MSRLLLVNPTLHRTLALSVAALALAGCPLRDYESCYQADEGTPLAADERIEDWGTTLEGLPLFSQSSSEKRLVYDSGEEVGAAMVVSFEDTMLFQQKPFDEGDVCGAFVTLDLAISIQSEDGVFNDTLSGSDVRLEQDLIRVELGTPEAQGTFLETRFARDPSDFVAIFLSIYGDPNSTPTLNLGVRYLDVHGATDSTFVAALVEP